MLLLIIFVSSLALGFSTEPDVGRECTRGEKGKPGIKYYLDEERSVVYPFYYKGCGGDARNRFDTENQGYDLVPRDGGSCPGWPKATDSCSEGPFLPQKKCKAGYECRRLGISVLGTCCNKDYADRYEKNTKAQCPGGLKIVKTKQDIYDFRLIGRKCAHNFCPSGSTCIDGEFEAFCCK